MPQMTDMIEAKPREARGKGHAHKIRKAGEVPAIVYGPGTPSRFLTLEPRKFGLQRQQYGLSHIFDVKVDGAASAFKALIREVQIDPLTQQMLHVDLYALDMSKPLHIQVPLELEGKPAGALEGGILQQIMRRMEVECLPSAIPQKVTVDVSALTIGQSVKASEVKVPLGVKIVGRLDQAVATVVAPEEEEVAPTPAAAAAEGAEGAAGAPAEGAAAAGAEGAAPAAGAAAGAAGAAPAKGAEKAEGGKEGKEGKGKR